MREGKCCRIDIDEFEGFEICEKGDKCCFVIGLHCGVRIIIIFMLLNAINAISVISAVFGSGITTGSACIILAMLPQLIAGYYCIWYLFQKDDDRRERRRLTYAGQFTCLSYLLLIVCSFFAKFQIPIGALISSFIWYFYFLDVLRRFRYGNDKENDYSENMGGECAAEAEKGGDEPAMGGDEPAAME